MLRLLGRSRSLSCSPICLGRQAQLAAKEAIPDEVGADSAALISQLRAEVHERDAKVNEVKDKAKIFVRDKLKAVQEAVKEMETRHEQFVGALAAVVPPPGSDGSGSPLPETNADGEPSALTAEERALLGTACSLLNSPPVVAPTVDTSEKDAEMSRLAAEVARLEAALGAAQEEVASARENQATADASAKSADELQTQLAEMNAKAEEQSATMQELKAKCKELLKTERAEKKALKAERDDALAAATAASAQNGDQNDAVENANVALSAARSEANASKAAEVALSAAHTKLQAEHDRLSEALAEKEKEHEEALRFGIEAEQAQAQIRAASKHCCDTMNS